MANVSVFNLEGNEVGTLELNDAVFGVEVNEHLVHMAVVAQLANKRQGTQKAKTRSEVSGGGKKPWRQKGTGHARQGSTRAPQWTGGGVVFAPTPRDYTIRLNKKEKRAALKSALTSRVNENKFIVVEAMNFDEIKTKKFVEVMNNLKVNKALVVLDEACDKAVCIMANVQYYDVILKPVVTEKSMNAMTDKKYTFLVHTEANKTMIKEAVEKMFPGTKVKSVNTMNMDGKTKRRGMTFGKTAATKKAIVQLTEDSKEIEIFAGL